LGLFDPRPKDRLEDFFDRERELKLFMGSVRSSPLTLVLGLRRYGKTSLILTGLNELRIKYIYLDCKALPAGMIGVSDLIQLLAESLSRFVRKHGGLRPRILKLLSNISGVSISGVTITVNLRRFRPQNLPELLDTLDDLGEEVVLVIDEAQELRRLAKYRADHILAYIYDNLRNVKLVLSGSQVGLLHRLLRVDDPQAPLYGRAYATVRLGRLPPEDSIKFLELGYGQHGLRPAKKILEQIVDAVDGVIGWLTYIGFKTVQAGRVNKEIIEEAVRNAWELTLQELKHFLQLRPLAKERYVTTLKAVATLGEATWTNIYNYAQARLGKIPKPTFNNILKNLIDAGFLEKKENKYTIADPILKQALLHTTTQHI